jgi:hypothetical protein
MDAGKKLIGSIAAQKEDELASLATFLSFLYSQLLPARCFSRSWMIELISVKRSTRKKRKKIKELSERKSLLGHGI